MKPQRRRKNIRTNLSLINDTSILPSKQYTERTFSRKRNAPFFDKNTRTSPGRNSIIRASHFAPPQDCRPSCSDIYEWRANHSLVNFSSPTPTRLLLFGKTTYDLHTRGRADINRRDDRFSLSAPKNQP